MYAVIRDRNQQTSVRSGDVVMCDLRSDVQPGDSVTFDEVLLVSDEGKVQVGTPTVKGASVKGEVIGDAKGPKLVIFRFKRRKNVRVKRGHRQKYTAVKITSIDS